MLTQMILRFRTRLMRLSADADCACNLAFDYDGPAAADRRMPD